MTMNPYRPIYTLNHPLDQLVDLEHDTDGIATDYYKNSSEVFSRLCFF